jgi:hypothetical protein
MSDNSMTGPGAHEDSAMAALTGGRIEEARVFAMLALASAVNRLASAQEVAAKI